MYLILISISINWNMTTMGYQVTLSSHYCVLLCSLNKSSCARANSSRSCPVLKPTIHIVGIFSYMNKHDAINLNYNVIWIHFNLQMWINDWFLVAVFYLHCKFLDTLLVCTSLTILEMIIQNVALVAASKTWGGKNQ